MVINVQIKQAGKRENKIVTAKLLLRGNPSTIEQLLIGTVKATHAAHNRNADQVKTFENGDLSEVMIFTEEEIENKASAGKVDFGFIKNDKKVTEEQAVENVLQAFSDGLVAVFIDGERYEQLSDRISLTGDETITFVKLTMLTGRLW